MATPSSRRSPRQVQSSLRRSLAFNTTPGTPTRRENAPIQPSPLRNEISPVKQSRKRARSLGGVGGDDPIAPGSAKQVNPRKKRMTIVITPLSLLFVVVIVVIVACEWMLMIRLLRGEF